MTWWEYVSRHSRGDTQEAIAEHVGVRASTVSRWKKGGADPKHVAAFARHYRRPVLEAFLAAGFLEPDEAGQAPAAEPDYTRVTNDALLELVRSRMRKEGEHGGDTAATNERSATDAIADLLSRTPIQKDEFDSDTPREA